MRLLLLAITLAGTVAYIPSFGGVFVFDDIPAIAENASLRSPSTWLLPPAGPSVSGRPVANLSFGLNYAVAPADVRDAFTDAHPGGVEAVRRNAQGYHAVNLVIHLLSGLALFGVIRRTLLTAPLARGFGAASAPLAATASALWLLHPLNTQAVTYLVQRTESLMALCYLVTLYCAIRAVGAPPKTHRRWMAGAVLACAAGMGVKEVMVTAPVMVLLWDRMFLPGVVRWRLYAALGVLVLIPVTLALAGETQGLVALRLVVDPERAVGDSATGEAWTAWTYLLTQAGVILHYLRLAAVPSPLVFDYADWPAATSLGAVAPQALAVCALVVLTIAGLVRRWPAAFTGAWFFGTLAPTSSVIPIPTEVAAEHRMYLPLMAVIALAVLSVYARLPRAVSGRPSRRALRIVLAGAVSLALAFGSLTWARNRDYASDERLWADTAEKRPRNARALYNHGIHLMKAGRFAAASARMESAAALPADRKTAAGIHLQLGAALSARGDLHRGIAHLERGRALDPENADVDVLLGQAWSDRGDVGRAVSHFEAALRRHPSSAPVLSRTAWLLATAKDPAIRDPRRAIAYAERAVAVTEGRDVPALTALAASYAEAGRPSNAVDTLSRAIALAEASRDHATAAALRERRAVYAARH